MNGRGTAGKKWLARLMRLAPMRQGLRFGLYLLVPRHRIGVNLVGFDPAGRVLLLKHVFHPFVPWGLPGGWLARGEEPEACLLRELAEETGQTARLGPLLLTATKPDPHHVVLVYAGQIDPAPLRISKEILGADWFLRDTLPGPLLAVTTQAIEEAYRLADLGMLEYR
ncbi:MAG: NUDIX domain-containing protein [Anaerolineae bacterium]|nr:NUDIX domain-containing protein [Anaerolineae bacterium]